MDKNLPILLILVLLASCALNRQEEEAATLTPGSVSPKVPGNYYSTLSFDRGKATLDEGNKQELNELALKTSGDERDVLEIKVLAWGDKEYPAHKRQISPGEVRLAERRVEAIKDYLEDELHSQERIAEYNMARRPNVLSSALKSDEWKLKEALEQSGATASRLPDGKISYTKASKALVIIDYRDQQQ